MSCYSVLLYFMLNLVGFLSLVIVKTLNYNLLSSWTSKLNYGTVANFGDGANCASVLSILTMFYPKNETTTTISSNDNFMFY